MSTKLIIGLGNPGARYDGTRHNVGFAVMDRLARRWNIAIEQLKWDALVGEGRVAGDKVVLMKPQTFMNLSGKAVRQAVDFFKIDPQDVIIVVDDIDIHLGTVRVREKGSAGTHNGLRSVVQELSSSNFIRIKIATGHRPASWDLADFVLSHFTEEEQTTIDEELDAATEAVEEILEKGVHDAMNTWNGWKAPSLLERSEEESERIRALDRERAKQDAFRKKAKRCGDS